MVPLASLAAYLRRLLRAEAYADDPAGVFRATRRSVRSLGLALDPTPGVIAAAEAAAVDALWLHRPWKLPEQALPGAGVLAHHLAFDERLTLGLNPDLADALGLIHVSPFGRKAGRPIGMAGPVAACSRPDAIRQAMDLFGGLEDVIIGRREAVRRVAVVGAMTPGLIGHAAQARVDLYLTGQLRKPALDAALAAGLSVLAVGHGRAERWGLRLLASKLRTRFALLDVCELEP